jgi:hypothetical protein
MMMIMGVSDEDNDAENDFCTKVTTLNMTNPEHIQEIERCLNLGQRSGMPLPRQNWTRPPGWGK